MRPTLSKRVSEVNVEFQPRRFVATMVPLRWLIAVAYGTTDRGYFAIKRIVGGPSWIDSAPFDIQAVTEEAVPQAMMRLMLQRLLEERFGLRLRIEQRSMEAYPTVVIAEAAHHIASSAVAILPPPGISN